jgi:hypothetical protein
MFFSNSLKEFTKYILVEGDHTESLNEGQWITIRCKQLFDLAVLNKFSKHLSSDLLIGFTVNTDHFTDVRMKLGKLDLKCQLRIFPTQSFTVSKHVMKNKLLFILQSENRCSFKQRFPGPKIRIAGNIKLKFLR